MFTSHIVNIPYEEPVITSTSVVITSSQYYSKIVWYKNII